MRGMTLTQVVVVLVILGFLVALIVPVRGYAIEQSRRVQCSHQIRSLTTALYLYADSPSNGNFLPTDAPTRDDPFAASGGAASLGMLYRQYVSDPRIFSCPSKPALIPHRLVSEIRAWDSSREKMKSEQTSYAYDPGHNLNTSGAVIIIGDKAGAQGNSDNHGPNAGQCVVFGTTAEFRSTAANPLDKSGAKADPNIYARNAELRRDEDSVLRE